MSVMGFAEELRRRASLLLDWTGNGEAAEIFARVADELEDWQRDWADQLLNYTDAEAESGYSRSHIGRMVRAGQLRNRGTKKSPLVRRGDLPTRPKPPLRLLDGRPESDLSAAFKEQIARSIVNRKVNDG